VLTQTAGFTSGFLGYLRKRLIDFTGAWPFIAVDVPMAIAGGLLSTRVRAYESALFGVYALLMLGLAVALFRRGVAPPAARPRQNTSAGIWHTLIDRRGRSYRYVRPKLRYGVALTGLGGFPTGLLGVGIGETVRPQLVRHHRVSLPVAAANSVFITTVVVATASATQIAGLFGHEGFGSIPWNAVAALVPGVLIGGQIGPALQGRVSTRATEHAVGLLFVLVALAMGWISVRAQLF
jgi:uncharacterized membrane protein YfcA